MLFIWITEATSGLKFHYGQLRAAHHNRCRDCNLNLETVLKKLLATVKKEKELINSWLQESTEQVNNYKTESQKRRLRLQSLIQNLYNAGGKSHCGTD